jgi:hypothetical protein
VVSRTAPRKVFAPIIRGHVNVLDVWRRDAGAWKVIVSRGVSAATQPPQPYSSGS